MAHTLYLVGTPLGNVTDWSPRAQQIVAAVPVIAAEDTRVTGRLLSACGISGPRLLTYTDAFAPKRSQRLADVLAALDDGDVALVSDAGMPGISDPGARVVQAALAAGHRVVPIPGPAALITALSASGFVADRFLFLGFLPRRPAERRRVLRGAADEPGNLIVYEAPHRLAACLADMEAELGDRRIVLARELTKLHEEFWYGRVRQALEMLAGQAPRGEYVVVLDGAAAPADAPAGGWSPVQVREALAVLAQEGIEPRTGQRIVARLAGWRKKDVYRLILDSAAGEAPRSEDL